MTEPVMLELLTQIREIPLRIERMVWLAAQPEGRDRTDLIREILENTPPDLADGTRGFPSELIECSDDFDEDEDLIEAFNDLDLQGWLLQVDWPKYGATRWGVYQTITCYGASLEDALRHAIAWGKEQNSARNADPLEAQA